VQKRGLFLLSAGAAAAAAAFATRRQIFAVVHGCGFPPVPPERARNIDVFTDSFHSDVLNASVGRVTIVAHPRISAHSSPALIFALPGRDGTAQGHADGLKLPDFLGNAVAQNARRASR
jgi:hypothetical protein